MRFDPIPLSLTALIWLAAFVIGGLVLIVAGAIWLLMRNRHR
jgi:hypothetical protein